MKNYDVCKDINDYYIFDYLPLNLSMPEFFPGETDEAKAVAQVQTLIRENQVDAAIARAEDLMQEFPHAQDAFLAWQVLAYWIQGKVPSAELAAYFGVLEESFPAHGFLNFNKAYLYVRDKNFNGAVAELKRALYKTPHLPPATALLFWIYYLAKDPQWRTLYADFQKTGLFNDKQMNLIRAVESIEDGQPTDAYLFADQDDIESSNRALLAKLAPLDMIKPPNAANILAVSADPKYLKVFVTTLLFSVLELTETHFGIHIHIFGPADDDINLVRRLDSAYPQLRLSYSSEHVTLPEGPARSSYYASMRFSRAYELLTRYDSIRKISVIDADSLVRKDLFSIAAIAQSEIAFTKGPDSAPLWDRFAAGFCCFSNTPVSLRAFGYFANIILKNASAGKPFWFIDQIAFYDTYKKFAPSLPINAMPGDDVFGQNMQHTDDAIFWTYTNDDKIKDNPMNRERKRLYETYGEVLKAPI